MSAREVKAVIGVLILVSTLTYAFCVPPARAQYRPDVMVAAVEVSAESVMVGETGTVNVTVANVGEKAQSIMVKAYLISIEPSRVGDWLIGREALIGVPPLESRTVSFTLDTTYAPLGDFRARGEADPVPGEINIADNTLDGPVVSVLLSPTGDVRVTGVTPRHPYVVSPIFPIPPIVCAYSGDPACRWMVPIPVGVEHLGNTSQGFTFNVTLHYVDHQGQENTTGLSSEGPGAVTLAPGEATLVNYTWNLTGVAPCKYNFTGGYYVPYVLNASTTPIPGDTVPSDNSRCGLLVVRLPGDINGDGWCTGTDLAILGRSWYKYPGDPRFDERADLSGDGGCTGTDLAIIGRWWYKSAQPA